MNYADMTKKDLEKLATDREIEGRSKMNKDQLVAALSFSDAEHGQINADTLKELKRRRPSMNSRDETGSVIRSGKNLSGNQPFRRKFYYLDATYSDLDNVSEEYAEALAAAPNQVKLILKFMRETEITNSDTAKQGGTIVEEAKKARYLQTKIPSANLFAYYRKVMEALGVREA